MANDKEVKIVIKAEDRASQPIKNVGKAADDAAKQTKAASDKTSAAMKSTATATQNAMGEAGRAVKSFATSSLGSLIGGLTVFSVVSTALNKFKSAVIGAINDAVNKAADMEKLRVVVEMTGESFSEMKPKINNALNAIKEVTGFTGGELRSALTNMAIKTGDVNVAIEQMPLVADMASSGLMDLEGASTAISMAMEGNVGRLGRLLPEMKNLEIELGDTASQSEKAEWILGKLNDRFAGMATNIDTQKEKMERLSRAWKEFKTNSAEPALPIIDSLTSAIEGLNNAMGDDKRGKAVQFWEALKEGWKNATPGQKLGVAATTILSAGMAGPGALLGVASAGGDAKEAKRNAMRIRTRNEELKAFQERMRAGEQLNENELKRVKLLIIIRDEVNAILAAEKNGVITNKEAEQALKQLAKAQTLRDPKLLKKIGAERIESGYTKAYFSAMDKKNISDAQKLRDRQLKDLQIIAAQTRMTDQEIADKKLEIYTRAYDEIFKNVRAKDKTTNAQLIKAANDMYAAKKKVDSFGVKEKKGKTPQQLIDEKLAATQLKYEDEIIAKKLEGNAELEREKAHLIENISLIEKMKDSHKSVNALKLQIQKIDDQIAKNNEEMWKKSDEADKKWIEDQEKIRKEKADDAIAESKRVSNERIANANANTIGQKRIQIEENNKLIEQLNIIGGEEEKIRDLNSETLSLKNDITNAHKKYIEERDKKKLARDVEQWQKGMDIGVGGISKAIFVDPVEIQKQLDEIEKEYKQTLDDIDAEVRIANMTGEKYDPLSAKADAQKKRIDALRGLKQDTGQLEQEYVMTDAQAKMAQAQEEQAKELHDMTASAIETGIREGGMAGLKSFGEMLKDKIIKKTAEGLTDALLTGGKGGIFGTKQDGINGGGGGGGIFGAIGGLFGKKESQGAPAKYDAAFGGAAKGGGGGFMDILGGVMPYVGIAMMLGGLFGKKKSLQQSGVQPLFDAGPKYRGTDTNALYSSDIFQRASFSARNKGGALTSAVMAGRMEPQTVNLNIKPSKEFDVITESKMSKIVKINTMKGVPRRTNFEH